MFNFSAGPAVLPQSVLERAQAEMLDWQNSGMSVMEMSHRGPEFTRIMDKAEADLRALLNISSRYKVLFLQGGAIAQNAMIPLNLLAGRSADYLITGAWSKRSMIDAQPYGDIRLVASSEAVGFKTLPSPLTWQRNPAAAYLHICSNETIHGVEIFDLPDSFGVPLVVDMSSHILSRPINIEDYGVIYAGAQKNIGPAGLCIVIVREDLLEYASPLTPPVFHWKTQSREGSMLNTPPTYGIYVAGLVFEWLLAQGGLNMMEKRNVAKAQRLYGVIDASSLYVNDIEVANRSRMNIPFRLKDENLNSAFLAGAEALGLLQLKGHRMVGGMRASIYNAMPMAGVEALCSYMREFEKTH